MQLRGLIFAGLLATGCGAATDARMPMCFGCPVESGAFAIVVTPSPEDATRFASIEQQVEVNAEGVVLVTLRPSVLVSGKVTVGGRSKHLTGSVVLSRPSRISGRPQVSYQAQIDPITGTYALAVAPSLPGEKYAIRIVSEDASEIPPQVFQVAADTDTPFDLALDDPLSLTLLKGVVKDPVDTPLAAMEVRALHPVTRAALSTTVVSDSAGAYAVRLQKGAAGTVGAVVLLVAQPAAREPERGLLALEAIVDVSRPGVGNLLQADLKMPPMPKPIYVLHHLVGTSTSGLPVDVAGAHCTFAAQVVDTRTGVVAVLQGAGETDPDGQVGAWLVPPDQTGPVRDYKLTIAPPASSPFAGAVQTVTIGANPGVSKDVELNLRPQVRGQVVDMELRPVKRLTVEPGSAKVAATAGATSLADLVKLMPTTTDVDGRFLLRVDPGEYELGLIPQAMTQLPRRWLEATVVDGDTDVGSILVPPGTMVRAQVLDDQGAPRPGTTVELFLISPVNSGCAAGDLSCLSPPRLYAEGTTALDGSVTLVLPAQVPRPGNTR